MLIITHAAVSSRHHTHLVSTVHTPQSHRAVTAARRYQAPTISGSDEPVAHAGNAELAPISHSWRLHCAVHVPQSYQAISAPSRNDLTPAAVTEALAHAAKHPLARHQHGTHAFAGSQPPQSQRIVVSAKCRDEASAAAIDVEAQTDILTAMIRRQRTNTLTRQHSAFNHTLAVKRDE
jgi:hypothetical protein